MPDKVRWAVLGAAKIATAKVIPAMQKGEVSEMVAIASRDLGRAREAAKELGIPRAYGSYEEVLEDPEVEAIYNPLPNHLHVPWSIRAAEAGKHVLCEKPIAMSVAECHLLIAARDRTGVKIGEAFMVRTHPQWLRARELVRSGEIGSLRAIMGAFSYFNRDPANIRNDAAFGGGGLLDIGCYPIQIARFLFEAEPVSAAALVERDPQWRIDRLTSAVLGFPSGQCVFTCSTQLVPYQRIQILGTKGRIEVVVPFNPSPDRNTRLLVDSGVDLWGGGIRIEEQPACDQYTIQGDLFCRAIRGGGDVPTPLEDSLGNMAAIEAVFESARTGSTAVVDCSKRDPAS
jgi:predicted dehydrogenase